MKIDSITIGISRTFNLGNYESLRVEASASASVDEDDDIEAARAECLCEVRSSLRSAYEEFKPKKGESQ